MFRALLKKQFLELNTFYFQDKKTGKKRSKNGIILFVLLSLFIFASMASIFAGLGFMLSGSLHAAGLDWLFFSIVSILALFLGVFGSVFNTYASLYKAKDNDFLLSMPIKPSFILSARLIGVFAMGVLYEGLVFVPPVIVYFIQNGFRAKVFISCVILFFIISVIVLVLTCLLGWAVAAISSKIKNKSFITVISSLAFLAIYYIVYFKMTSVFQNFADYSDTIASGVKNYAYPLYMMGQAAAGDIISTLILCAASIALFAVTYFTLSKSFTKITASSQSVASRKAKKQKTVQSKASKALLLKELRRFISSPTYMLNCALGTVILPLTAIAALVKRALILETLTDAFGDASFIRGFLPLIITAAVCICASMNDITAPSISLEGKNIWLIQSLPIPTDDILSAKINLHIVITAPVVIFSCVVLHIAFASDFISAAVSTLLCLWFVTFLAQVGLCLNLKMPNLTWQNEAVPVKQSMSVFISMFGGWVTIMIFAGAYIALRSFVNIAPAAYLAICLAVIVVLTIMLDRWLRKKGTKIFEKL